MKSKKVWRYYCEYCKKSGCSKYHIKRHEESCTANPERFCRMCEFAGEEQNSVEALVAAALKSKEDDIQPLRDAANNCPVCILTGIRLSKRQEPPSEDCNGFSFDFDFQREKKDFFSPFNDEQLGYC